MGLSSPVFGAAFVSFPAFRAGGEPRDCGDLYGRSLSGRFFCREGNGGEAVFLGTAGGDPLFCLAGVIDPFGQSWI